MEFLSPSRDGRVERKDEIMDGIEIGLVRNTTDPLVLSGLTGIVRH